LRHLPNLITLARIALIWPILTALMEHRYGLALGLLVITGVSDGLDGFLAKHFRWTSELGKFLDPLADKMLLIAVFVTTTRLGISPPWVTAVAVARDVLIGTGALTYRLWLGPLHGYPTMLSKLNTAAQLGYLLAVLLHAAAEFPRPSLLNAIAVLVCIMTLVSGVEYVSIFTRRAWHADTPGASRAG
jgi:cardiolipin synthase